MPEIMVRRYECRSLCIINCAKQASPYSCALDYFLLGPSFSSRSDMSLHQSGNATLALSAAIHRHEKNSAYYFAVFYRPPSSWGSFTCRGINNESSELIHNIFRPLQEKLNHGTFTTHEFSKHTHFGSFVSSMRATNLESKIRLLHTVASMLLLPVFSEVPREEAGGQFTCWF